MKQPYVTIETHLANRYDTDAPLLDHTVPAGLRDAGNRRHGLMPTRLGDTYPGYYDFHEDGNLKTSRGDSQLS
jgi:hypothetical protein